MCKWLGMNCGLDIAESHKAKEFAERWGERIEIKKKRRDGYGMSYMAQSQAFSGRLL